MGLAVGPGAKLPRHKADQGSPDKDDFEGLESHLYAQCQVSGDT